MVETKMNRRGRLHRGLTLIELMIVLIILVMLFAIAGPRLLGTQDKADVKGTMTQIGNLETALKMYAVEMRTFPNTEDGLAALIKPPADEAKARKWNGPYLDDEVIPADAWGQAFVYEYPPINGQRDFRISRRLERTVNLIRKTISLTGVTSKKAGMRATCQPPPIWNQPVASDWI